MKLKVFLTPFFSLLLSVQLLLLRFYQFEMWKLSALKIDVKIHYTKYSFCYILFFLPQKQQQRNVFKQMEKGAFDKRVQLEQPASLVFLSWFSLLFYQKWIFFRSQWIHWSRQSKLFLFYFSKLKKNFFKEEIQYERATSEIYITAASFDWTKVKLRNNWGKIKFSH